MARQPLTKKTRFEVFKRDGFKCQYCGKTSSDVVLEVDHIKPVKEGGTNEMINLITSCFDCNRGKGKTKLSDDTIAKLEQEEIKLLKAKKEQMDFYLKWKKELSNLSEVEFEKLQELLGTVGREWNENGKKEIIKLLKKYGFQECYESLEISIAKYKPEYVGQQLPKILAMRKTQKENPDKAQLYYIRGIIKNRFNYINEKSAIILLTDAYKKGYAIDELKEIALTERNWSDWKYEMERL